MIRRMVNFYKFLFMVLFAVFVFSGCGKDEEVAPKSNLTYDGKTYDLANGLLIDYGQYKKSQGHEQVLFLYSSGVTVHERSGKIDSTSGKGNILYFEIFSPVSNALGEGDYTFDDTATLLAKTFGLSYVVFNADYVTASGEVHEIIQGKVNVKKDGNIYELTFACTEGSDAKKLTGYYKGPLKFYDAK
jgi:hypothetical protein